MTLSRKSLFVSNFVDWALCAVVFTVFTKYFGAFADAGFFSSCAKRDDAAAVIAADSTELYALGFRSEKVYATTFHAFGELVFLQFLSMYNI